MTRGQRSKATPDQTREEHSLQDGNCRAPCSSWIVVKFWYQLVFNIASAGLSSSTSSSSATERSDDRAPGNWRDSPKTQNKNKKHINRASDDRLRDLPERLEEFTENPGDTEVLGHPHTCLMTQIRNGLEKRQVLISCAKGEAKNYVCNPERSGFKAWKQMVSHFDPRTGADRSVAYARATHLACRSRLTSSRPKTEQCVRNLMQTREQKVA